VINAALLLTQPALKDFASFIAMSSLYSCAPSETVDQSVHPGDCGPRSYLSGC
jgi:hypothetical protein